MNITAVSVYAKIKYSVIVVFNLTYLGAWTFMTCFGAVKDATQLSDPDMELRCFRAWRQDDEKQGFSNEDMSRGDACARISTGLFPHHYASVEDENSILCCTSKSYKPSYKILHVTGGALGFFQFFYFASLLTYRAAFAIMNFVFLFETQMKTLFWIAPAITMTFVYHHLVYNKIFCEYDLDFCNHDSRASIVVNKVFKSLLIFAIVFFVLQATTVGVFVWTFESKRRESWNRIRDIETSLFFDEEMKSELEVRKEESLNDTSTWDMKQFLDYWMNRKDDDIMRDLPQKSFIVTRLLLSEIKGVLARGNQNECEREVGENGVEEEKGRKTRSTGSVITRAEFSEYCDIKDVLDGVSLWDSLTLNGAHDEISVDSIEDLLYELFFHRKQLAHAIFTDHKIGNALYLYASATIYPGCLIAVSKIFEYKNAFGEGIDLFKTYAVIVSYIYSNILGHVQFLLLMLKERPFNIGDVLEIDGHTYAVVDFTTTHTTLVGSTKLVISNDLLVSNKVTNLTRHKVMDTLTLELPLSCTYEVLDMRVAMTRYIDTHPRDVIPSSVRVEWLTASPSGKTLRCMWRYKFTVMDRSRLIDTRVAIVNHLMADCKGDIARANMADQLAAGGGLNNMELLVKFAETNWEKGCVR